MVLAVAILVFGPKRIPEIAGSMGKGIREFKRHINEAGRNDSEADQSAPSRTNSPDAVGDREPKRLL